MCSRSAVSPAHYRALHACDRRDAVASDSALRCARRRSNLTLIKLTNHTMRDRSSRAASREVPRDRVLSPPSAIHFPLISGALGTETLYPPSTDASVSVPRVRLRAFASLSTPAPTPACFRCAQHAGTPPRVRLSRSPPSRTALHRTTASLRRPSHPHRQVGGSHDRTRIYPTPFAVLRPA